MQTNKKKLVIFMPAMEGGGVEKNIVIISNYLAKYIKNIELITRLFFNHRRKMIRKPFNQLFNGNIEIKKKLKLNLNLRPQNLDLITYYKLTKEYEELRS